MGSEMCIRDRDDTKAATEKREQPNATHLEHAQYRLYQYTTVSTTRIEVKPKPPKPKKDEPPRQAAKSVEEVCAEKSQAEVQDAPEHAGRKRKRPIESSQDGMAAAQSPLKKSKLDEQAEDGIRDRSPSRGLGDVYKRQG